jgi:site-specific recombinase XerC
MTAIAPHMTAYLRQRLPVERVASQHTCDTYAYAFQILLDFASHKLGVPPSTLQLEHLDAPLVLEFLEHLQSTRGNAPRTRNARLTAIKSFMHFVEHRVPGALEQQSSPRHSQSKDRQTSGRPSHCRALQSHPRSPRTHHATRHPRPGHAPPERHRRTARFRVGRATPR